MQLSLLFVVAYYIGYSGIATEDMIVHRLGNSFLEAHAAMTTMTASYSTVTEQKLCFCHLRDMKTQQ